MGSTRVRQIRVTSEKQAKQRAAIGEWVNQQIAREPGATVVVVGDTNNTDRRSLYGVGREAGELNAFAATHLTNKCYDRLVVAGAGKWTGIDVLRPPYRPRPNDANKRVWTDHFFVGATLRIE